MATASHVAAELDRLAAFDPGPFSILSLYLDLRPNEHGRDQFDPFLRKELAGRLETYRASSPERKSLEEDVAKIRDYVSTIDGSVNALAVFASSGANLFDAIPLAAPIEMIEFSDFQCPFCLRADPTVRQVLGTYGDRIRFVYRHYPLPNHPNARPAAEAAACAGEQGKFWPYHDRLFANPAKLSDADLKQGAAELGLNAAQFNACVDTHKLKAQVDADIKDGEQAGVNGTPAFFVNGRMISGAQPYDVFKKLIDEELELKKR